MRFLMHDSLSRVECQRVRGRPLPSAAQQCSSSGMSTPAPHPYPYSLVEWLVAYQQLDARTKAERDRIAISALITGLDLGDDYREEF